MNEKLSDIEVMGMGVGAVLAIGVAGLLGAIRGEVDQANVALALVGVVALAAYTGGRKAGAATGIVAAASFDVFHTRPYGSLTIKSRDDVITTILLVVIGLVIGQISTSRREARAHGKAGADEVAGLYRVASLTADDAPTAEVVGAVEVEVAKVLRLSGCRFERGPLTTLCPELEPSGRVDAPYRYEGDGFALPAEGIAIDVHQGAEHLGWLVGAPADPDAGVSRDRRRTALVLADHLALTLAAREGAPSARSTT